jgi:hypothetical protein
LGGSETMGMKPDELLTLLRSLQWQRA